MNRNCRHNLFKYIYFIFIFITGIYLISLYNSNTEITIDDNNFLKPMELTGVYQERDSYEWIPFNCYDDIKTDSPEITIITKIEEDIPQGTEIMFFLYKLNLKVLINGEVIYESQDSELGRWESFVSPGINDNDQIRLIMKYSSVGKYMDSYKCMLDRLYYGTSYSLLKHQIKSNLLPIGVCILIIIVGISILVNTVTLEFLKVKKTEGYFACGFLLISGGICTFINYEYITLIFNQPSLVNVFDLLLEAMICEFLMLYFKSYLCTQRYRRIVNFMVCIWPLEVLIYFLCQYCKLMQEENDMKIMLIIILFMFFIEITYLIKDYITYKHQSTKYVLISAMILLGATILEIVHFFVDNIFWIYVFQEGLLFFTFVQLWVLVNSAKESIRQAEKARKLETELVQNNVAIMLSQIQPHFLYNSLTSIGYLCEKEPRTARKLLYQFSDYLRVNMDSLKNNKPVPFLKELEHVKTYLELEKVRFDEELNVEYDIETTGFMIPALTVQPIVENAVKHGVSKKENGGTVKLSVRETDSDYVVIIEDDGIGFDKNIRKNDGKSHIGIENVRKRLDALSNGKLFITSEKGVGTSVIIKIPKKGINR